MLPTTGNSTIPWTAPNLDAAMKNVAKARKYQALTALRVTSGVQPPQNQRRIGAAEAERVRQHGMDPALLGGMRHEIDGGRDRRVIGIDGWRGDVVADRQHRENRLDRASRAH